MRRLAQCLVVALVFLGGCAGVKPEGDVWPVEAPPPNGNSKVAVGERYIDFAAPDLAGGEIRLSSLVGQKVLVLQFWGIRCAPCLAEMTFLSALQQKHGSSGLQVIGVNTDRVSAEALSRALAMRGLDPSYLIAMDPDFSVAKRYTHWLIPVTVLIDRSGVVRSVHTGYRPELEGRIDEEVRALLGN